jgi:hypothetical protein
MDVGWTEICRDSPETRKPPSGGYLRMCLTGFPCASWKHPRLSSSLPVQVTDLLCYLPAEVSPIQLERHRVALAAKPSAIRVLPTQNVGTIWEHLLFLTALSALESLLSIPENAS